MILCDWILLCNARNENKLRSDRRGRRKATHYKYTEFLFNSLLVSEEEEMYAIHTARPPFASKTVYLG